MTRFSEAQVVAVPKEGEAGVPVAELIRKHGINRNTYFNWKSRYSGAEVSDLKRLKDLEAENAKLKLVYLAIRNMEKKWTRQPQYWNLALNQFAIMFEGQLPA